MLKKSTADALLNAREEIKNEFLRRARLKLEEATENYVHFAGDKDGIEQMAEDFCRLIGQRHYWGGWTGILAHMQAKSG